MASGVVGLEECVRTFHRLTGVPLVDVIRMATLTPARIAGVDHDTGSLAVGKRADLVVLDRNLFAHPASEIALAQADLTLVDGAVVHARPGAGL